MKKIFLILNIAGFFIFSSVHIASAIGEWSAPVRLDSQEGKYSSAFYSPNGELRIFYNIKNIDGPFTTILVVRTRLQGENILSPEVKVVENGSRVTIHYAGAGNIDLAVQQGQEPIILKSTDNGQQWNGVSGFAPKISVHKHHLPLAFSSDDSNLRLFYVKTEAGIVGDRPFFYLQNRINDVWDNDNIKLINSDATPLAAYEFGDKVTVISEYSISHSADNGQTFTIYKKVGNDDSQPYALHADDSAVDSKERIYAVRSFIYGLSGQDQNLVIYYSDDHGTTWLGPQYIFERSKDGITSPRIAVDGDNIIVVWIYRPFGQNLQQSIRGIISQDRGVTWGPVQIIYQLNPTEDVLLGGGTSFDIVSHNGRVSLVYSSNIAGAPAGVYLMEMELPQPPLPPQFIRGDSTMDGQVDISDPIHTLRYLFLGGPISSCLDAADADDDGSIDIADPIKTLFFLFEGVAIPAPSPQPGPDPTKDDLGCSM